MIWKTRRIELGQAKKTKIQKMCILTSLWLRKCVPVFRKKTWKLDFAMSKSFRCKTCCAFKVGTVVAKYRFRFLHFWRQKITKKSNEKPIRMSKINWKRRFRNYRILKAQHLFRKLRIVRFFVKIFKFHGFSILRFFDFSEIMVISFIEKFFELAPKKISNEARFNKSC